MELSRSDLASFRAAAETILPAVDGPDPAWSAPLSPDLLRRRLPQLFASLPHDTVRRDLKRLLGMLRSAPAGLLLFGWPRSFLSLSARERSEAYRSMESNPLGLIRAGARALKTLTALIWVTAGPDETPPPAWNAMGYPGPEPPPPPATGGFPILGIQGDQTWEADVVVVGSGAAGGTAAGVLARAGLQVVVLEAGRYQDRSAFTHLEADAYRDSYLQGALALTSDGGTTLLAGAVLGGGTLINYTTSFPTPTQIREEWDRIAGFDGVFTGDEFEDSSRAVLDRLGVNTDHGWPSQREVLLEKGLRSLGWHVDEMPRNVIGCQPSECGFCTMGCRLGAKRTMVETFLGDAARNGARIVTGASVDRVTVENERATGVMAKAGGFDLRVKTRVVVLAAGALNTPAILLRSRRGGAAVGRYLHLHPVTAVWGRFPERVDPWTGTMQARYSDQFQDLDGRGYGFKLETAPVHPLFPAALLGWEDGLSFKRDILGLGYLGLAGILLRDRDPGRARIRADGSPIWDYSISAHDQKHIRAGVRAGAQVLAAAGAEEIISSTVRPVRWRPGQGTLDDFMAGVDSIGYGSNRTGYFSFHQMGSARMGADPTRSVLGGDNQVHDTAGLYVLDGSCFPTASGVNPMITIATIAHRSATRLAQLLS
jgi:choline dehydrogenase-like flavoprotein